MLNVLKGESLWKCRTMEDPDWRLLQWFWELWRWLCHAVFISIPCAVVGVVLGAVSLAGQKPGKGMAIAGIVCSIVSLVPTAFVFLGIFGGLL